MFRLAPSPVGFRAMVFTKQIPARWFKVVVKDPDHGARGAYAFQNAGAQFRLGESIDFIYFWIFCVFV